MLGGPLSGILGKIEGGLALACTDAAGQDNYLVDFVPPYRPDKENREFALVYTLTAARRDQPGP
jgi:hypothetical protein